MYDAIRKLCKRDDGVSPVIGTILMVAVTVVLGATVYAALSGFGDKNMQQSTTTVWTARALDTDGDGKTDALTITYVKGPSAVADGDVSVLISKDGTALTGATAPTWVKKDTGGTWNPGDFATLTGAGTYSVTASVLGTTALNTVVKLDE